MGNLTTSGACAIRAGANVSTNIPETTWNSWISGAEGWISDEARYDFATNWTTLNDKFKYPVIEVVECLVAINAINYDVDTIGRSTAESRMTMLRDIITRGIKLLTETKTKDFMGAA